MLISCTEKKQVDVISTIKPIHMLLTAIAGEHLQTKQLIPDGASPHHYALKPSDIRQLHNARLVFQIDKNLESFLAKPLKQSKAKVVSLAESQGIQLIALSSKHHGEEDQGHAHQQDLHIWLNPDNAIAMSRSIAKQLALIDPSHEKNYKANLQTLIKQIQDEDRELKTKLKPIANKPFIVFHNAWGYFEQHYGLKNITTINENPNKQLGAATVKTIRALIQAKRIECLFSEPQYPLAIIQTLSKGSQVKTSQLDVLGSKIKDNENGYVQLLRDTANGFLKCD
jgi:zinc transport system substrate-binding protein